MHIPGLQTMMTKCANLSLWMGYLDMICGAKSTDITWNKDIGESNLMNFADKMKIYDN